MIKKNKKLLILTSLLTLLPIAVGLVLWNRFPEAMAVHWGLMGETDGFASKSFSIFFPSVALLAVHWLCILFTSLDRGNRNRNRKMFHIVLWIIPIVSNLTSYLMYALALGIEFNITSATLAAMGILFAIIGNYMPKTKMNSTMGIRVPWTYTSEENWNATHRFGGKCWMIGGILMALAAFLPGKSGSWVWIIITSLVCIVPILYSYMYYRKQKEQGDALMKPLPKMGKGSGAALVIVLLLVSVMLFAGDIEYEFLDKGFIIETYFYNNYSVLYEDIQAIEYRDGNVSGMRVGGYGSFRLLMGYFQNEEFGTYTRYTYYKPEACVVLTVDERTLVLSGETKTETESIYQELLLRTGK